MELEAEGRGREDGGKPGPIARAGGLAPRHQQPVVHGSATHCDEKVVNANAAGLCPRPPNHPKPGGLGCHKPWSSSTDSSPPGNGSAGSAGSTGSAFSICWNSWTEGLGAGVVGDDSGGTRSGRTECSRLMVVSTPGSRPPPPLPRHRALPVAWILVTDGSGMPGGKRSV